MVGKPGFGPYWASRSSCWLHHAPTPPHLQPTPRSSRAGSRVTKVSASHDHCLLPPTSPTPHPTPCSLYRPQVRVWDALGGVQLASRPASPAPPAGGQQPDCIITGLAMSADGLRLITGSSDLTVRRSGAWGGGFAVVPREA